MIRVIPNTEGFDLLTEYEVSFDERTVLILFEAHLRLLRAANDD